MESESFSWQDEDFPLPTSFLTLNGYSSPLMNGTHQRNDKVNQQDDDSSSESETER
jgi:hypothetical protein